MPVETKIDLKRNLTVKTVSGNPSFEESMTAFREFYEGPVTKYVLWDFNNAHFSSLTTDHIEAILDYIQQHAPKRAGGKTAILISKDLEYGMSRMAMALSEVKGIPFKMGVFRSMTEAERWLMSENL